MKIAHRKLMLIAASVSSLTFAAPIKSILNADCGPVLIDSPDWEARWRRDAYYLRSKFEELEASRAGREGWRRALSSPEADVDLILLNPQQLSDLREHLVHANRVWFTKWPARAVKYTVKSESALSRVIDLVVTSADAETGMSPLREFMEIVDTGKLLLVIDGWPGATAVEINFYGAVKKYWGFLKQIAGFTGGAWGRDVSHYSVSYNGECNAFDFSTADTFRAYVRRAPPADEAAAQKDLIKSWNGSRKISASILSRLSRRLVMWPEN